MVASKKSDDRQGFRATVSKALNQVALGKSLSCFLPGFQLDLHPATSEPRGRTSFKMNWS